MSTSIRISEETKRKIDRLKRPDETFDELIDRLASEEEGINFGAIDEETRDRILEGVEEHREATRVS
jgi:predicted CopG family antitoxin